MVAAQAGDSPLAPITPAPPETEERWLLVDQLGAGTPASEREEVQRLLSRVAREVEWVTPLDDSGLELVSRAKAAIGIGTPADPRTRDRLLDFLGEAPEVDGLVWMVDDDGPRALTLSLDENASERMKRRLGL